MAFEYTCDHKSRLIRITGQDDVSMEDRVQCLYRMFNDPDLPASADILIEVNGVTNAPEGGDILSIGTLIDWLQRRFGGRVGIVNAKTAHVTISHLVALSVQEGDNSVQVFPTDSEARKWLSS